MTSQVLESVVKNCGQTVHDEVASKQTMEELKDLLKVPILQCICILPVFFSLHQVITHSLLSYWVLLGWLCE